MLMRGTWSRFARILLGLLATNAVLGGVLFALRPPWSAAAESAVAPTALPPQVEELRGRIAEGRRGEPYVLDLSDEDLSAMAGYFLARAPDVPFTRVRVAVAVDQVAVEGVTKGLAVTVPVRAVGSLSARDGLPRAHLADVSLGPVALPGPVRAQILREANRGLDFSRYPLPVTVDTVELRPGGLTLRGTVKTEARS